MIRRTASCGDWIVGLAPKRFDNSIVYAMKVTEKMSMAAYWRDRRFRKKRPRSDRKAIIYKCGDNIYEPLANGKYLQKPSGHSHKDGSENLANKEHDLSGKNVLISEQYCYYGAKAIELPNKFKAIIPGRGHKRFICAEPTVQIGRADMTQRLVRFLEKLPNGVHGQPRRWPADDESWNSDHRLSCGCRGKNR